MFSLDGLNKEQKMAAGKIDGPLLILAGAGSGKTRTVTYRIAHMIDNLAIPSTQILGVSFTNKAAREMVERMHGLLGAEKCRGLTLSTFHSLCVRILREDIEKVGLKKNFSIYDTSDQISIIRQALKCYKDAAKFEKQRILSKIGFLKNQGIDQIDFANSTFFDPDSGYDHATNHCYHFYQEKLKFYNAIDFDDILFLTVRLFAKFPEVAKKYSTRFKYVMIDEYQDTNDMQFELVRGLTSTHQNICVVGDDDQAIYSFRGANISNILNFEKQFKNATVIKLEENYRSTRPILALANSIIAQNKNRKNKMLRAQIDSDHRPILWACGDHDHEAKVVAEEIVGHRQRGGKLKDIAVLYRGKMQAPVLEDAMRESQIPYTIIGGQKFYDKKEVKDLIAYLSAIANPNDEISMRRILNVPNRGIGNTTLTKFLTKAEQEKISLFSSMERYPILAGGQSEHIETFVKLIRKFQAIFKTIPLNEAISNLVEEISYFDFIDKQHSENAKQAEVRKNDISYFIESAGRFAALGPESSLRTFMEKIMLQDSQDREKDGEEKNQTNANQVTLMTLHSSKGLEFDIIYLVGLEEEILPHKKTINEGNDISEELRLCYVGVTRARKKLFMTYCKERQFYGKKIARFKSRFISEIDKSLYLEQDRTTFGHLSPDEARVYKSQFFSSLIDKL
ncbi:MAG: hypothetical protein A2504_02650 [Bdellovibrionales bacterium RIFOXYD12_FULL_39_22]|nr:MAG: hypothetical protein A2385_12680 [Bdellovibrionales bacterium RIFOXYB1_FULL_39_21]OFZ41204.1 MAG: hypothetical protein A2485_01090 [Bdellovibrionales bacterium RIFOXYC12_FULL_39_17]OFZ44958.1 MAG: hypothetical protein A2404_11835 [Bdellovibrionales bacterium RIFOXYC1_FULL_39_130]OFZ74405.1 MAG: hypothetical protein A2560_12205 [Bdellovibrionales bacterium RIFOXYD1_FULL_39_84]OFZ74726.1 MAG: hypothetical protein A2451_09970 [Bdellovibrionales bacterium RIFOXYC2_FULL_39_8]OFZ92407.1 MAG: